MGIAARVAAWERMWSSGWVGWSSGGAPDPHPFLSDVFPFARQSVEAAFDADPNADPDTWSWTDITRYVQWTPGVRIRIGYTDEALRPLAAGLGAVLRNDQAGGGDWTLGNALSPLQPHVRENLPIRARIDLGSGPTDRICAFLTGVSPVRNADGALSLVKLEANGYLRRLKQGKSTPFSALRKSIDRSAPRAYWSLEQGAGATVGASAVAGVPAMTITNGTVDFGASSADLPSSLPVAQFSNGGQLVSTIPPRAATADVSWRVEFITKMSPITAGNYISIIDWNTTNTVERWNITASPVAAGGLRLQYTSATIGGAAFNSSFSIDDGEWHQVRIDADQSGGNIALVVKVDNAIVINTTLAATIGDVTTVTVNFDPDPDAAVSTLGHLAVWDPFDSTEDTYLAFRGHAGETVAERLARISTEAGVRLEVIGDADDLMGPQRAAAYLDLVQDAIDVDGGALFDGLTWGLTYYTRQSAYSRPAALTLDAAAGDFLGPLEGRHDDSGRVNVYTASDPYTGADATFTQEDGDLGTDMVGEAPSSGDHRVNDIAQLDQIAAFQVGRGTVGGVRWPALVVQFAKAPTSGKAQQWLDTRPLDRIDALGISLGSNPDRRLVLRGWSEWWNSKQLQVTLNTAPYDAYAVTVLAEDAGDTGDFLGWLEVDEVHTITALAAGDTSLDVRVTGSVLTNPSVSTYADDIDGLYINLDGLKVGVTAISAPTGTVQTLTLVSADVLRAVQTGSPVSAWYPVTIGL